MGARELKKELPQWALWAAVATGLIVIAVVAFAAFGAGSVATAEEKVIWQKEAEIAAQRAQERTGQPTAGISDAPAPNPGGSGEAEARARSGGQ